MRLHEVGLYNWEDVHDQVRNGTLTSLQLIICNAGRRTPCVHLCTPGHERIPNAAEERSLMLVRENQMVSYFGALKPEGRKGDAHLEGDPVTAAHEALGVAASGR